MKASSKEEDRDPAETAAGTTVARMQFEGDEYLVISKPLADPAESLTGAQREVLACLLRGEPLRSIAFRRATSIRTVANQVQAIYRTYAVNSREELVAVVAGAVESGRSRR